MVDEARYSKLSLKDYSCGCLERNSNNYSEHDCETRPLDLNI